MIMDGGNKYLINSISDFFLPRFCVSCSSKLDFNEKYICKSCHSNIKFASKSRINREFERKFKDKEIVSDFFSFYVFEKDKELQNVIHSLKYKNNFGIGIFLGKLLANELLNQKSYWDIDSIIPIPLHQLKKAERGYNQSFYIAKGINKILKRKLNSRLVKRVKYTESQTSMNLMEREQNISGAFKVRFSKLIDGKNILLVDDVITTGATISECASVLLKVGAKRIYAASVGIAD